MKPSYNDVVREAQAMQTRFAEQTRKQIKVSNRLSVQRDAVVDVCEATLRALEALGCNEGEMEDYRKNLEVAKTLDLEEGEGESASAAQKGDRSRG